MRRRTNTNLINRAFRCTDGIIRWIIGMSKSGNYTVLWLDESENVWNYGYIVSHANFIYTEEIKAPQFGETYQKTSSYGLIETCIVK